MIRRLAVALAAAGLATTAALAQCEGVCTLAVFGEDGGLSCVPRPNCQGTESITDTQPPTAPTNVSAKARCAEVLITWTASTDDTAVLGYNIYRSDRGTAPVGSVTGGQLFFYDGRGSYQTQPGVTYTYTVKAFDEWNYSAVSNASTTTPMACYGSGADTVWSKRVGGLLATDGAELIDMAIDGSSNINIVGKWNGTADFDGDGTTATSAGSFDVIIAKYALNGNGVWSKSIGAGLREYPYGIATDAAGNVFIVGEFEGTVNFGCGNRTSAGGMDIFVAKYQASNGTCVWSRVFGSTGTDRGTALALTSTGTVWVTGYFDGIVDFGGGNLDANSGGSGGSEVFLLNLSSGGAHNLSFRYGVTGTGDDKGMDIAVDGSDNVYLTGVYQINGATSINFGGGSLPLGGSTDVFVVKFNSSGTHVWSKGYGDLNQQVAQSIALDNAGNAYVSGWFRGTTTFGTNPSLNSGGSALFMAKLAAADGTSTGQWSSRFADGASTNVRNTSINIDSDNNVILVSSAFNAMDMGGGSLGSVTNMGDTVIAKYTSAGVAMWSRRYYGPTQGAGMAAAHIGTDSILGGWISSDTDFGTGALDNGASTTRAITLVRIGP